MDPSGADPVNRFALELVSVGSMMSSLVADLARSLPVEAYPGEEPDAVVMEMMCGTIAAALDGVDATEVRRATELIACAADRIVEHLRLARELSRRVRSDRDGGGRFYG